MLTWKVSLASGLLVNPPNSIEHIVGIQTSVSLPIAVSLKSSKVGGKEKLLCGHSDAPSRPNKIVDWTDAHPVLFPLSFGPYRPLDILCLPIEMYYVHLSVSQEQFCCLRREILCMTFPFEHTAISAVFYNVQRFHDRRNPVAIPDYFVIVKNRD
jgi:hypothetical protein